MSQENVAIVLRAYATGETDLASMTREEDLWAASTERLAPYIHPDFGGNIRTGLDGGTEKFSGLDGLRAATLSWLAPLATYRREVEEAIDLGDRVLLLVREYAQPRGSAAEINISPAHLLTLQDGRIIRYETWPDRADALKAVGLEG